MAHKFNIIGAAISNKDILHVLLALHMLCKASNLPQNQKFLSCINWSTLLRQIFSPWYQIWTKCSLLIWFRQDAIVWYSDSLLGRRRVFRSRVEKLKPCGMTLPQLELWDRGRWAWGEKSSTHGGQDQALQPSHNYKLLSLYTSTSWAGWVLQEKPRIPVRVDHTLGTKKFKCLRAIKSPLLQSRIGMSTIIFLKQFLFSKIQLSKSFCKASTIVLQSTLKRTK